MRLAVFQVHAQQHGGPVLGFGAAGAGLDFEEAGHRVGRVVEHAAEFEGGDLGFQSALSASTASRVSSSLSSLPMANSSRPSFTAVIDGFENEHDAFQCSLFLAQFLGAFRIVPDLWDLPVVLVEEDQAFQRL